MYSWSRPRSFHLWARARPCQERKVLAVNTADKIGLLPGFGWLANLPSFWATLAVVWLITPVMMFVVGLVFEGRMLPISPRHQFLSFFPGDLFLGAMTAGLLTLARRLPDGHHWYNAWWWHVPVLVITCVVAFVITKGEYSDPNGYGHRAVLSPTKLYHNGVLYGLYGYVVVVLLVAVTTMVVQSTSWTLGLLYLLTLVPGAVWACLLVLEQNDAFLERIVPGVSAEEVKKERMENAHQSDWRPLWAH